MTDFRAAALHVFAEIIRHHDGVGVDDAALFDVAEIAEMVVKSAAEQGRANGVAHHATFLGFELKVGVVGAEVHRLAAAEELERPGAGDDSGFKLELAGEAWPDGRDALDGFVANPFVGDEGSLQAAHRNGGFVHHVHDHENDVFIIVVNFHAHRHQASVEGAGTGAVVIAHRSSPFGRGR